MEIYAHEARAYMERSGATRRDFAAVAAKNSRHGALNPLAQYRVARSVDEVGVRAPRTRGVRDHDPEQGLTAGERV